MLSPNSKANLRRGNPGNRGRPKGAVRARYLRVCDLPYLCDVAAGKRVIVGDDGKLRRPSHQERVEAFDRCLRYGLGTEDKREHSGEIAIVKAYVECSPSEIGSEE